MAHSVDIELTGGFRNAGLILETVPIELDEDFKWSGEIEFIPPMIDGIAVFKGSRLAQFTIKITINGVTKEIPGYISEFDGRHEESFELDFSDFDLPIPI